MSNSNYQSNRRNVERALTEAEEQALLAIGGFVEGAAKYLCPVGEYDNGRVGGNLRSSINHKVNKNDKSVVIGTNVEYAPFVEKGTSKMAAQPYLTPAIENNTAQIKQIVETHLRSLNE